MNLKKKPEVSIYPHQIQLQYEIALKTNKTGFVFVYLDELLYHVQSA